jgi:small subunit ribosomal protein S17
MSDDETKKDETTETQDEAAEAAGPVSDETSSPGGEDASSSPPAAEAAAADAGNASPEEGSADDAPAAKEAAASPAEPNPEDDLPWKERRRLQRSRRSSKTGPELSTEERVARRAEERRVRANLRRKQREAVKAEREPGTGTPPAERDSNAAKVRQGIVVSSKGDKSITVRIDIARRHRTYEKIVRSSTKLHAHDERNEAGEGDVVRVIETRPLSKTKRWRLVDVVEKAR